MKPLDRTGRLFLAGCVVLFLVGVVFRLNGSSVFLWKQLLHEPTDNGGLLLAEPQPARTDEWMVWTPAARWQAEHHFPAQNPSLGPGQTPFLYSLPVKHYTMLVRPQLWGFFLFGFERGYAWYWNTKVFGLLASLFLLFFCLTGKTWPSLFGTLWLFFSNYIQWWFSCPPMLPEMLSSWAVAILSGNIVVRAESWWTRLAAGAVCIGSLSGFVLCLYPPFQIPLAYLGVALFGALAYRDRNELKLGWPSGLTGLFVLAGVAALLVPFFLECRSTFELLAGTSYPGQRRSHGGEIDCIQLFSGLVNFFNSETAYPAGSKSANEAANFLPLWLPVLAVMGSRLWRRRRENAVALASLAVLLFLVLFALVPLPGWFCDITGLSYCTGVRALLAIGLAGIVFVTASLPLLSQENVRKRLVCLDAGAGATLLYLFAETTRSAPFFSGQNLTFLFLDLALLFLLLGGRVRILAFSLVALLAASNALVNPVMSGLAPLTTSPPALVVRDLTRADPEGVWAAFDGNGYSEFLMAEGANVISGWKLLPDLTFYGMADPTGASRDVYNRYSNGVFQYRADPNKVVISSDKFPLHLVEIHPRHPSLKAAGVRYFVFEREIARPADAGLKLLRALPNNRLWIYGPETLTTAL